MAVGKNWVLPYWVFWRNWRVGLIEKAFGWDAWRGGFEKMGVFERVYKVSDGRDQVGGD